jgi:signal transduction histidine kinase
MTKKISRQTQLREKSHQQKLKAERQLSEAERLATIGQFSAGLAHEMNNPLTVILGSARMAQTAKGVKLKNWLNAINREADRCKRLVNDLLTFARPIELHAKKFDLAFLVRECWFQIPKDDGQYQINCPVKPFRVAADPDRIKQVLVNLMQNAVEAMPGGGVVDVRLTRRPKGVQMSVGDSGTGISKKNLAQLFRPFFTTKSMGTGLGLVIARSILQAHKGRIRLEPRKPRGLWIRIEWPQS